MGEEIDDELTYKIIGCAMKVHSTLGNGFQELIYQRALAAEFERQGIQFDREVEMPIFYEEKILVAAGQISWCKNWYLSN
jgi:GxxExxY protein